MKEVACAVCGAVYRFAPAEIPPAGKTLTCAKCKARVVVPGDAPMAGGAGDVIDLADLPAPRRIPAPPPPRARPAEPLDLPMPSLARPGSSAPLSTADLGIDLPAPKGPPPVERDPLTLDSIDLLAPVGPSPRGEARPAVGAPIELPPPTGVTDLPAPKRAAGPGPTDLPPAGRGVDLPDLPAPKRAAGPGLTDRPPGRAADLPDLPAPKRAAAPPDLPTPRRGGAAPPAALFDDLPAPKGPVIADLPAPKRPSGPGEASDLVDLNAPQGLFDDLPQPKGATKGAAKGPATSSTDVAPKGFFDDLPQPKGAAKGPATSSTDVAPKGFFADLPQPKGAAKATSSTDVAPKGFFADLPQPKGASTSSTDVAPKGFFDDLPQPVAPAAPGAAPTGRHERSASIDLDGLDLGPSSDGGLELEPVVASARQAAAAPAGRTPPSTNPPPLELGDDGLGLDGLDLPSPSTGAAAAAGASRGVVSFKPASSDEVGRSGAAGGAPGEIDLAVPSRREPAAKEARPAARAATRTDDAPRLSRKLQRVLLIAALALAAVGAGGYLYYQRWQGHQQRAADIRASLDTARQAMTDGNKNGWGRAVAAARQVIALDPRNAEAQGLAAQALLAAILDDGAQAEARRAEALRHLQAVPAGAGRTPAVERAQALDLVLDGDLAAASARLEPLAARGDGLAQLFLGWARLAAEDWDGARAAFEAAGAALPRLTATTRLGAARALLGKGEREAARAAFLEVIAADKEHVGALVGEAEAMPPHEFVQRENALLAILQRKGIDAADPRVVARAWALAGDDAARAGRLDAARERYRRALTVLATDVGALVSAAALELRDGKLDEAAAQIEKAIGLAPTSVRANLVAAELDLARSRLADAAQRLAALRARTPPLAGDELGRLHLIDGMRLEAEQQPDAALAAYAEAAGVLGADALEPAIASAMLLGRMAGAARAAKDEVRAKALEAQASERLERLAAEAEADPTLAVTLGVTYLAAGAAADSERWLRKALARRPRDVEATFQLAEALRRQGKQDEALATLVKAFELDPTRIDLGVELARGFEAAGEDGRAAELFRRLVAVPTATLDVRLRAGRFFARVRDVEAARKQGELILEVDPASATGQFLRAEGLIADGNLDEARTLLQRAVKADPDPQFLDGLGRACEALAARSGDTARRDEALTAYVQASDLDPKMLNPRLGRGRLHMERNEHGKALAAFQEALELAPAEPSIPYGIGMAYAELNDRPRAVEWLTRAVRAKARADAYYRLGVIHFDMENSGAAAAALARATELGLADERALGVTVPWLTDAYWLLGTAERARASDGAKCRAWRAYLERNPTNRVQADEVRREMLGCR